MADGIITELVECELTGERMGASGENEEQKPADGGNPGADFAISLSKEADKEKLARKRVARQLGVLDPKITDGKGADICNAPKTEGEKERRNQTDAAEQESQCEKTVKPAPLTIKLERRAEGMTHAAKEDGILSEPKAIASTMRTDVSRNQLSLWNFFAP